MANFNSSLTGAQIEAALLTARDVQTLNAGIVKADGSGGAELATPGMDYGYPVLTGVSAPTTSTVGLVGQMYFDRVDEKIYICTDATASVYTWVAISGAGGGAAFATCSTAKATQNKVVSLTGFVLKEGAMVAVRFTNGNSAATITLNVNSTGDKLVYGTTPTLSADAVSFFVYDGTYWRRHDWTDTDTYTGSVCTTAADTTKKRAKSPCPVSANQYFVCFFTNANTAEDALTFQVYKYTDTSVYTSLDKPLYINGTVSSASNCNVPKGSYIMFYDGTNYYLNNDGSIPKVASESALNTLSQTVSAQSSQIEEYNSHDIELLTNGRTHNGVTYAWSEANKKWTISGTATALSFCNIIESTSAFPTGIKAGNKLGILIESTDSNILVRCYAYKNGSYISYANFNSTGIYDIPNDAEGLIIRLQVANGLSVNGTISVDIVSAPTNQQLATSTEKVLKSSLTTNDDTARIRQELESTGHCKLGVGTFYVSSLNMPDGASIEGCGHDTVLVLPDSISNGYAIKISKYNSISNLRVVGSSSASTPSQGSRIGILFEAQYDASPSVTSEVCFINNVEVIGFNGDGLRCNNTSIGYARGLYANNLFVQYCYNGINIKYCSEFNKFVNCCVVNCYDSVINDSGNNNFSNCTFHGTHAGFVMHDSYNDAHGAMDNCTFCHIGSNNGIAILCDSITNYAFTNLQIHYCSIQIEDSTGIIFSNVEFGNGPESTSGKPKIDITGEGAILFANCMFISGNTNPPQITLTNNTQTRFVGCFDAQTGAVLSLDYYATRLNTVEMALKAENERQNKEIEFIKEASEGVTLHIENSSSVNYEKPIPSYTNGEAKLADVLKIGGKSVVEEGELISADVTDVVSRKADTTTLDTLTIPQALRTFLADKGYGQSAGTAYNEIDFVNKKYIRRVGSLDLGTLNWTKSGSIEGLFYTTIADAKDTSTTSGIGINNAIISNYALYIGATSNIPDKSFRFGGKYVSSSVIGELLIKDSTYISATAAQFKTAMSGINVIYELETPIEYDISSYLDGFDTLLKAENGGSLTFEQDGTYLQVPNTENIYYKLGGAS